MAAPANITNSAAVNTALSEVAVKQFNGEYDRLASILGITKVKTVQAGHQLYQIEYTGDLDATAYEEGDTVPLTKITATKKPIEAIALKPYRRETTANAVLTAGVETAVIETDKKVLSLIRNGVVGDFITTVKAGTGVAEGKTLQATIAAAIGTLSTSMESKGDAVNATLVIANTQDVYDYLGNATISSQNLFGMLYFQDFLGFGGLLATSKIDKGTVYVTDINNIKAYGVDMEGLNAAGFPYVSDENGIIGVAHTPALENFAVDSHFMVGVRFIAEVLNYTVKGTIKASK